jgi:hypothetical protein
MSVLNRRISFAGGLGAAVTLLAAMLLLPANAADAASGDTPAATATAPEPGAWQPHSYEFHSMGFTSTYSCDGLGDKLKLLLRLTGARADVKVMPSCARGYGVPARLAEAKVEFSTLQPAGAANRGAGNAASAAGAVNGVWRHVELTPRHPFDLQSGDCELVEQFRDTLLPMFAIRNLQQQITCVPHQDAGSAFSLSFDVFAAPLPAKGR